MGVADRVYMRRGGPPPIDFRSSWTVRHVAFLAVVFVLDMAGRGESWWPRRGDIGLSWDGFAHGRWWTIVTAALVHADTLHVLFNLLGLWYFGKLVEETLGGARFVALFWMSAVLSHVPFLVAEALTGDPTPTIGVSGVVMTMLVFAALRYPGMPWSFWGFPVKLWQLAAFYVAFDVFGALRSGGDLVDHWTHLGGAAVGLAAHRFGELSLRRLRVLPHGGRPPREPGPFAGADPRDEIDRILDKINRDGVGSLTDAEKAFLKENSGRYR